jgi:hypothetical protein
MSIGMLAHISPLPRMIRIVWLKQVFEHYTKPTKATTKRMLIVNGHSSHVDIEFFD